MRSQSQALFSDIQAEIAEAVDFLVHIERQPARRSIREVLRVCGYERSTQQFRLEQIYSSDSNPNVA
jgi:pilus assembly protein CpaF